ncbi:hypothetical protein AbraIFM66951_007305 [Aspergillus brasiliensis]|uniref:Uncharacterized protein n=1 Tax=Aspergillus brasiliensis TaxID=319629 RepID=A0A9W5YTG0_9EURO|nr:hypothetical protein AbraCBS73388_007852 [Aspergillus brasiliensis]GKZ44960.1 hypothetical protein AbraIFM66951_007305 [Aspergillus brasiliensis]
MAVLQQFIKKLIDHYARYSMAYHTFQDGPRDCMGRSTVVYVIALRRSHPIHQAVDYTGGVQARAAVEQFEAVKRSEAVDQSEAEAETSFWRWTKKRSLSYGYWYYSSFCFNMTSSSKQ